LSSRVWSQPGSLKRFAAAAERCGVRGGAAAEGRRGEKMPKRTHENLLYGRESVVLVNTPASHGDAP